MARKSLKDRNIRKISRTDSGSAYITIPIEFMRSLKWREKQKVVVSKSGQKLIIKDWPARNTLKHKVGGTK